MIKWDAPTPVKDAVTAVLLVVGFALLIWLMAWYTTNWGLH